MAPRWLMAISLLAALGCQAPPANSLVARVGDFPITLEEVELRVREEKLSSPEIPVDFPRALIQLQKAYLQAEILKTHGLFTDQGALEAEALR
ncbi:MAG: hypothetical protein ACXVCH_17080, partial [Bdellovibrionota bacterium]